MTPFTINRSKVSHSVEGETRFSGLGPLSGTYKSTSKFTSPETIYLGLYYQLNQSLRLSAGIRQTQWDRFEEIRIQFPEGNSGSGIDDVVEVNWKNTWS